MTEPVPFTKMHGAGNDYVYFDATGDADLLARLESAVVTLSNRNFGVGSDGVIAIGPSAAADVRIHMWNADGSRGALCVNGLRCAAWFAHDRGAVAGQTSFVVETDVGLHPVELLAASSEPGFDAVRVQVARVEVAAAESIEISAPARVVEVVPGSAGNPHAVVFLDSDPEEYAVLEVGAALQTHPRFQGGVNVEFVRARQPDILEQRTFERGSGETLACGSGAIVASCAALETGRLAGPTVRVRLRGGELSVTRRTDGDGFDLVGPVAVSFRGEILIPPA